MRMTKAIKDQLWAEADERYRLEAVTIHPKKTRPSTGAPMKARELDIRDMVTARGIQYSTDLHARSRHRADIAVTTKDGRKVVLEVKHGAGAVAYADPGNNIPLFDPKDLREPGQCLVGADYVVYHRYADITDRHEIACEYLVLTREDFLDILTESCHGPRSYGFQTATKVSHNGEQINIQSMYVDLFWEALQADERCMTLWDFCSDILGREPRWTV